MKKWIRWFGALALLATPAILIFLSSSDTGLDYLLWLGNRLSAGHLTVNKASGSLFGSLQLQGLRYTDSTDTVIIENVRLDWKPSRLLNKHFQLDQIDISGVRVILGPSTQETIALPSFSSPIDLFIEKITVENIEIVSDQEEMAHIQTGTIKRLSLQGQDLTVDALSLATEDMKLQAKGQLKTTNGYPLQLALEAFYHRAGYEPISGKGTLNGPLNTLEIEANTLAPFPVRLQGQVINLLGDLNWQARMEGAEVALRKIHNNWPDQLFSNVVIDGRGTSSEYSLHLDSSAELLQLKQTGKLSGDIQGNLDGLQVNGLQLAHGKTSLTGRGTLGWSPALSWTAEVASSHLNPSLLFPDWPGDISCTFNTTGKSIGNNLEASFNLPQLQGTLRNLPLTGTGEVHLKGKQLQIQQFSLMSAGSSLRINGESAETIELSLQIDSNNLGELWPNARGKLHAQGRLTGNPAQPKIDLKLTGTNVGLGYNGVGNLTLETKGTLSLDGQLDAALKAEQLDLGSTSLKRSNLHFQGSMNEHTVTVETQDTDLSAGFLLQGKFIDKLWQGSVRQMHFTSQQFGTWQQRTATPFSLSMFTAEIKPLCLTTATSSSICLNGSWSDASDTWQLHGKVSSLPLDSFKNSLNKPWPIEGLFNGTLDLSGKKSGILVGKLLGDSSGMIMHVPLTGGAEQTLKWKKNSLRADYANRQLQILLDSELTDKSTLHLDLGLANLQLPKTDFMHTPWKGAVQLHIENLTPFTLLTEQMVRLSGTIQGQFTIKGTPADPMLNGQLELANGQAEIPSLGITLSPLSLDLKGDNSKLRLLATARSGSGFLRAESSLNIAQSGFSTNTVMLTGEAFQAAHLPGLDLDLSPDLQVVVGKKQIDIRGTVTVPKARIKSIDFDDAISPSNDMIVIDEEQMSSSPTADLPLYTAVTVIAGDDVQIDAYGLRGILSGKLQVYGQPDRVPVGNGTLSVQKGTFTMYGKRLKINLGRLLFTGGSLSNPGIQLRSENKSDKVTTRVTVEGFLKHPEISFYSSPPMEQSAIVLNLLENTAFGGETREDTGFIGKMATKIGLGGMVPYLQSIKKFSMIDEIKFETGNDFDSMSLIFGSWVTPRFYVSYGNNLMEESGIFTTRYTLGNGFYFMTETGATLSGGDLKYEFEH